MGCTSPTEALKKRLILHSGWNNLVKEKPTHLSAQEYRRCDGGFLFILAVPTFEADYRRVIR
jgi:hypothetical protein